VTIDKRMCLVKTLLEKILWDKKPSEGKRVQHSVFFNTILYITYSISPPHINFIKVTESELVSHLLKSSSWQKLYK